MGDQGLGGRFDVFKTVSHYAGQTGLELEVLLPRTSRAVGLFRHAFLIY